MAVVETEQHGQIMLIQLNRPDRMNAVNWDLCKALADHFRMLRTDDDCRVIVLTGAGGNVSSGGDAEFLSGNSDRPIPGLWDGPLERYQRKTPAGAFAEFTRWIIDVDKPVIAAVNGTAAGGGYELALACDHIMLIDDGSSTVSLPELPLLAVLPGTGGLTRLVDKRMVRHDRADFFCTTFEGLRGKRSVDWNLVDELVPGSRFDEMVNERAREFADKSDRPKDGAGVSLTPLNRTI